MGIYDLGCTIYDGVARSRGGLEVKRSRYIFYSSRLLERRILYADAALLTLIFADLSVDMAKKSAKIRVHPRTKLVFLVYSNKLLGNRKPAVDSSSKLNFEQLEKMYYTVDMNVGCIPHSL